MAKRKLKKSIKALIIVLMSMGLFFIFSCVIYITLSSPVDKNSKADIELTIESGTHTRDIGKLLKKRGLIKSEVLFNIIARFSKNKSLKASTYQLRKSMSLDEIIDTITNGNKYNPNIIKITFVEGETIKKYAMSIAINTDNTYEDVINTISDKNYLNELINKYWFLSDEILNEDIYFGLEGYLAPNTYEFNDRSVTTQKIIETMLNQTKNELKEYKDKIESGDKTVHEYITIASMLELEGTNTDNRKMIAGIFNNRLKQNMNLGSDVTTYYALQVEMKTDLTSAQFATINPYNTRATNMRGKLPIGPICNPSLSSIKASTNPTNNNYLYFVADKRGKIYYTKSVSEHEQKVSELKESGEWIW